VYQQANTQYVLSSVRTLYTGRRKGQVKPQLFEELFYNLL